MRRVGECGSPHGNGRLSTRAVHRRRKFRERRATAALDTQTHTPGSLASAYRLSLSLSLSCARDDDDNDDYDAPPARFNAVMRDDGGLGRDEERALPEEFDQWHMRANFGRRRRRARLHARVLHVSIIINGSVPESEPGIFESEYLLAAYLRPCA